MTRRKRATTATGYVLEAEKYAQDLIPRARGRKARIVQDAEAYRDRVIADAEGEAARVSRHCLPSTRRPRVLPATGSTSRRLKRFTAIRTR